MCGCIARVLTLSVVVPIYYSLNETLATYLRKTIV